MNLDLGVHSGDVVVDRVDPAQHPHQQETVVVVEVSGEGLLELADLRAHPGPGHLRENLGLAFPGDHGGHHRPT